MFHGLNNVIAITLICLGDFDAINRVPVKHLLYCLSEKAGREMIGIVYWSSNYRNVPSAHRLSLWGPNPNPGSWFRDSGPGNAVDGAALFIVPWDAQ